MRGPSKLRILVVEDDIRMLDLLSQGLREAGHTVMPASDGQVGLELATSFSFDIIVLDIGLPLCSGYEIARALRGQDLANKPATPILMLTARDAEDDIIRGFDLGADDYLIKPFSFPELLARLNALARAALARKNNNLVLDSARSIVMRDKAAVQLTRTEFLLLQLLAEHAGKPVTRQRLIQGVWGNEPVHSNTLDVFINALRSKIDAPFASRFIVTVRGIGYRLQLENNHANRACEELAG
jgi:DNA-binding response OmpR family regulator